METVTIRNSKGRFQKVTKPSADPVIPEVPMSEDKRTPSNSFLMEMSREALRDLDARIAAELHDRDRREREAAAAEMEAIAKRHGLTVRDVFGDKAPTVPKYRHPQDPAKTWAGKGRRPHWLAEYVDNGGTLEELQVY